MKNESSFEEKFDRLAEDIHVMRKTIEKWEGWDKQHHEKYVEGKGDGSLLNPNIKF